MRSVKICDEVYCTDQNTFQQIHNRYNLQQFQIFYQKISSEFHCQDVSISLRVCGCEGRCLRLNFSLSANEKISIS